MQSQAFRDRFPKSPCPELGGLSTCDKARRVAHQSNATGSSPRHVTYLVKVPAAFAAAAAERASMAGYICIGSALGINVEAPCALLATDCRAVRSLATELRHHVPDGRKNKSKGSKLLREKYGLILSVLRFKFFNRSC